MENDLILERTAPKPLALLIDENAESNIAIAKHLRENGFEVIWGTFPEVVNNFKGQQSVELQLIMLSSTNPQMEEARDSLCSWFPAIPLVMIGQHDHDPRICRVFTALPRPIDSAQFQDCIEKCNSFNHQLREYTERYLFLKHAAYLEEPIARIIHDLNNQITGLKGGVDLLSYSIEMVRDPEMQNKFVRYMEQFIQPSLGQIEQLVASWRRLRENRLRPSENLDLGDLARRAILLATSPSEQPRIMLRVRDVVHALHEPCNQSAPIWIYGNSDQLSLSFGHIIRNAIEAVEDREDGKVSIQIEETADEMCRLRIFDNGEGIPDANRVQVWKSFYTTKGSWRNGLGLAIAKQIVDKHQGQIEIVDSPLGGAGFQILLPTAASIG